MRSDHFVALLNDVVIVGCTSIKQPNEFNQAVIV